MLTIIENYRKGERALLLENKLLRMAVLPGLGGKIASLVDKASGFELTAQPQGKYKRPEYGSDFSQYDASGLDDAFPCLHACEDKISGFMYPDHGEIWSAQMTASHTEDGVRLDYQSPCFPYDYQKTVTLSDNKVILRYHIQNTGTQPFPCIWAFHGLFRYETDMKLLYPPGRADMLNVLESKLLGPAGKRYPTGGDFDFGHVPAPHPPAAIKYYLAEAVRTGVCGFRYPGAYVDCLFHYDPLVLPYLGVWITAGGFRGDYNCALEPCNGFYDDIPTARQNGALYTLVPEHPLMFSLTLTVTNHKFRGDCNV